MNGNPLSYSLLFTFFCTVTDFYWLYNDGLVISVAER